MRFKSAFRSGTGMREGQNRTSRLQLEDSAAAAFPTYLDYAYTGELHAQSASATALLHLASYLRCRALHSAVTEFMQDDLDESSAALYFAEAELYSLEKVTEAALAPSESKPSRRVSTSVGGRTSKAEPNSVRMVDRYCDRVRRRMAMGPGR